MQGVALVLAAIFGPVSAVVIALMNNRNVKKVGATVDEINHAVNGKGPTTSSISEDVATIMRKQEHDLPSEDVNDDESPGVLPLLRYLTTRIDEIDEHLASLKGGQ